MKKLLKFSALLSAVLLAFVIVGCGGSSDDTEKDTTPPTVTSTDPADGATAVPANASVTITFSEKMDAASVTVTGVAGAVTFDTTGKIATFKPSANMPAGPLTLTINGKDLAGNALAAKTLSLTVTSPDTTPPDIVAGSCSPANGAAGVDPATVTQITIVFTEAMASVKLDAAEPTEIADKLSPEFDNDKTLTIKFLGGYRLGNEMNIKITLSGADKAGNPLKTTVYQFATMKKEG